MEDTMPGYTLIERTAQYIARQKPEDQVIMLSTLTATIDGLNAAKIKQKTF